MKWQLGPQGWPVGQFCIPPSTIVSGNPPTWNGIVLPTPPMDAVALDDEAAAAMRAWYHEHRHRLQFGPDVGKSPQTTTPAPTLKKATKGS
jgi:hypothetical protein